MKTNSKQLILHVIDSLTLGGAERVLVDTIELLPEYDHLVCYLGGENKFPTITNARQIISLNYNSDRSFLQVVIKLRNIINKHRPALTHAHLLKSTWLCRVASLGKCPLIFTVHNKLSEDAFKVNKLSLYVEKLTYSSKQKIIGVSNGVLKDYHQWIGIKGESVVVYNLVGDRFFNGGAKDKVNSSKGVKLVATGNLRRQKNYLNLLRAFCYLRNHDIALDIYGDGDEFEILNKFIVENNLPVTLKGKCYNIHDVLPNYDAFILSSMFEGYGIAVVEAMAVGLPVLLSDIDVFREVSNNEAIYFEPSDPENMAKAILQFYQSSGPEREKFGVKMKQRALSIASPALFREKLLEIYSSSINANAD